MLLKLEQFITCFRLSVSLPALKETKEQFDQSHFLRPAFLGGVEGGRGERKLYNKAFFIRRRKNIHKDFFVKVFLGLFLKIWRCFARVLIAPILSNPCSCTANEAIFIMKVISKPS